MFLYSGIIFQKLVSQENFDILVIRFPQTGGSPDLAIKIDLWFKIK